MCDCVMEECTAVAMTTLSEAQLAWQIREKAIIMEEVGKVVAMEMESGIILEQVSQIVMEIFRYVYCDIPIIIRMPLLTATVTRSLSPW